MNITQDNPTTSNEAYQRLCDYTREVALLASTQSVLEWDQQTRLPPAGGEYRASQIAALAGLVHRRQTLPEVGQWLAELKDSSLAADPHGDQGTVIRQLARQYEKKVRLPQSLVEELTHTAVLGQQVWAEARKANEFGTFQPLLEKTLELKRQEAAALGYETTPYDPLLDDYEPGETTENVSRVLANLRDALVPIVQSIAESANRPDATLLAREFPIAAQEELGRHVAAAIGFDFNAGVLDETTHPMCAGLGPGDVRISTRYDARSFGDALFSILHESGHGIYDQGLPREHYGLPTGEAVSLGIHESQSRLWENQVGRGLPFWKHFFPMARKLFPESLSDVSLDQFTGAINDVHPSLIRVEADEVTYNLHILIRFELEQSLIEGDLSVTDLPAAWNEKYQSYLGIRPSDDASGILQDVHWSAGLFGYFPTYALGNMYAAQFYRQAWHDLDDLDSQIAQGQFGPLRQWLRTHIHLHGQRYTPSELVQQVTGKPLSHQSLLDHLQDKFGPLYGL